MPLGPLAWPTFILFTEKIYNKNFPKKISPKFISGSVGGGAECHHGPQHPLPNQLSNYLQKNSQKHLTKNFGPNFFQGGGAIICPAPPAPLTLPTFILFTNLFFRDGEGGEICPPTSHWLKNCDIIHFKKIGKNSQKNMGLKFSRGVGQSNPCRPPPLAALAKPTVILCTRK